MKSKALILYGGFFIYIKNDPCEIFLIIIFKIGLFTDPLDRDIMPP